MLLGGSNHSVYQNGLHQTFSVHEECETILNVFKSGHDIKSFEIERGILYAKQKGIISQNRFIASQKDTVTIWEHFRSFTNKANSSQNTLPDEP